MLTRFLRAGLPALALLLAAGACEMTGNGSAGGPGPSPVAVSTTSASPTPTSIPSPAPTPTPTATPKKPFFPALASVGGSTFAQVTNAPAGSSCAVRAFLKPTGPEISGPGLKPRTVQDASKGVSWDSNNGDQLFKAGTASGQPAYWQFTCTNTAYNPTFRVITRDFTTP